ncbi:MAG: hypothetical protein OEY61_02755 [Gammaproteobacteria bacterium]|nr:hypothetical protein [Gammaproteobacteria bacterium]
MNSLTSINSLLVDIKSINNSLLIKLQETGFDTQLEFGPESEYTARSLSQAIETMVIHFLTITANRHQFLQRTGYEERKEIESLLKQLYFSLKESQNNLNSITTESLKTVDSQPLAYISKEGLRKELPLRISLNCIDMLKPYSRMLELIIAQERIHALSAVLETLLHSGPSADQIKIHDDQDLTSDQQAALELSHYFIKQAL